MSKTTVGNFITDLLSEDMRRSPESHQDPNHVPQEGEPDFYETQCHWKGCTLEFDTQEELVRVRKALLDDGSSTLIFLNIFFVQVSFESFIEYGLIFLKTIVNVCFCGFHEKDTRLKKEIQFKSFQ